MDAYRFYFMVGTKIMQREEAVCADDADAGTMADRRLDENGTTYDAIEVWDGTRMVCRRERVVR